MRERERETSERKRERNKMSRSTFFVIVKYSVFLNWTLTGFWIIYNSTDYSKNAQIISETVSGYYDGQMEKQSVVYGLIAYTISMASVAFFGLVGVCYERCVFSFAVGYLVYIIFDVTLSAVLGVPFNAFMIVLTILFIMTCGNLFLLGFLIRANECEEESSQMFGDPTRPVLVAGGGGGSLSQSGKPYEVVQLV